MKKKGLAMILTLCMAAGTLSGCGGFMKETSEAAYEETAVVNDWEGEVFAETTAEEKTAESTASEEYPMMESAEAEYDMAEAAEETVEETAGTDAESAKMQSETEKENTQSYIEGCYDYDTVPANAEEYSQWEEKGFSGVLAEPLSTFSADVDTASYSNLRRMITDGYEIEEIPEGAVRVEEMLNYFDYDYEGPEGSEPFGVTTHISKCPWNDEAQLLMIGLQTEEIDYEQAPPSNLVFLLDVSGSMSKADKLPLLQEAFSLLAENLTEKDKVSIVTYAGEDQVVLRGADGDETRKIKKAINDLEAGGGTHGSKGIETAYEIAEEYYIEGGNNRVILATDGDLNIGLTTEEELEELITEKKESGIFLSVLGFGTGNIKDNKMETLADKGNGNYAYIDSMTEAKKVLVEEMAATLLTICKDVKLQVEFNPAVVSAYRLIGYENRALNKEDFHDDTKDAGEIGAGHSVTVLYELILKDPLTGMSEGDIENLKYKESYKEELEAAGGNNKAVSEEWLTLSIRYKKPAEEESSLLQYPIGFESYEYEPDDDFVFAAAVAEFGLLASHSSYQGDASVKEVKSALKSIDLNDAYKEEFYELVKIAE